MEHPAQRPRFLPGTTEEAAAAYIAVTFSAIAQGWPAVYFRQSALQGGIQTIDLDSMIRDAGAFAVEMQAEAMRRISPAPIATGTLEN